MLLGSFLQVFVTCVTLSGCSLASSMPFRQGQETSRFDLHDIYGEVGKFWALATPFAVILVMLYKAGAKLFTCAELVTSTTAGMLFGSTSIEWLSAIGCAMLGAGCSWTVLRSQRLVSERLVPETDVSTDISHAQRWLWRALWLFGFCVLTLPSVLYVAASSLPENNTLFNATLMAQWYYISKAMSFVLIIISNVLVPWWANFCSASGINPLETCCWVNLFVVWLLPATTAVLFNEDCFSVWLRFWSTCYDNELDISIPNEVCVLFSDGVSCGSVGNLTLLTTESICRPVYHKGRCARSVLATLSPLYVQKAVLQCTVAPVIFLAMAFFQGRLATPFPEESTR